MLDQRRLSVFKDVKSKDTFKRMVTHIKEVIMKVVEEIIEVWMVEGWLRSDFQPQGPFVRHYFHGQHVQILAKKCRAIGPMNATWRWAPWAPWRPMTRLSKLWPNHKWGLYTFLITFHKFFSFSSWLTNKCMIQNNYGHFIFDVMKIFIKITWHNTVLIILGFIDN